jgi:hypothetical protein
MYDKFDLSFIIIIASIISVIGVLGFMDITSSINNITADPAIDEGCYILKSDYVIKINQVFGGYEHDCIEEIHKMIEYGYTIVVSVDDVDEIWMFKK